MKDLFHKFPSTPHLAWLGRNPVREDKVFTPSEAADFLSGDIVAEEKIDGANLGISVGAEGQLHFQNRGNYLQGSLTGQWKPLRGWAAPHLPDFLQHLNPGLILFGEWCYTTHSVAYSQLPDWFLVFDVFDTRNERFWSTSRRNELADKLGLSVVPKIFEGSATLSSLAHLASEGSKFAETASEGIYLRRESDDHLEARAKLVNPNFTQAIGEHWSRGALRVNRLAQPNHSQ
jgi:ATP-dependent RNA circularization protein (DNA/RNA ligase family)